MPPRRTCAAMSMSKPAARSAARSAIVAFEPGRMTRSASPGSAAPGRTRTSSTVGLGVERIEIVEIGDVRQDRHGDAHARVRLRWRAALLERERIFGRQQPRVGERTARGRAPPSRSRCAIAAMPSANSAGSPRNLLTMKPRISAASSGVEHRLGADEARDHAAAVDVADQHDRHIGRARKAHIGDVVRAQVDLRRAAGALDQHEIGLGAAGARSCRARTASARASSPDTPRPWRCRYTRPCTTICAPISLCGFSSTGFMCTLGGTRAARACSACARPISPPSAVTAALFDMFCGLNGRTARPRLRERARKPGDDQRLADVRAGALEHERARRHAFRTRCPAAPSRRRRSGASPASSR